MIEQKKKNSKEVIKILMAFLKHAKIMQTPNSNRSAAIRSSEIPFRISTQNVSVHLTLPLYFSNFAFFVGGAVWITTSFATVRLV